MKNRGYFCDWYKKNNRKIALGLCLSVIVFLLVGFKIAIVSFNEEDYFYDEEGYKSLEETVDRCVYQDGMLNLKMLQELTNVSCELPKGDGSFCHVICSTYNQYNKAENEVAKLELTISNEFTVIEKKREYSSKEEYLESQRKVNAFSSILYSMIIWFVTAFFLELVLKSAEKRSKQKKEEKLRN